MNPSEKPTTDDLADALHQTLRSDGWQKVILPNMQRRLQVARAQLETGIAAPLEHIRALQAEIALLRVIVERPEEAFK